MARPACSPHDHLSSGPQKSLTLAMHWFLSEIARFAKRAGLMELLWHDALVRVWIRSLMKIENSERRLQISIWARNGPKYADSPGCGWPSKGERDLSWSTRQGRDVSESSPRDLSFNQILSKETFLHPTSLSEMVLWVRKKFNTHLYLEDGESLSYFFMV